jgi:hypothetical protein
MHNCMRCIQRVCDLWGGTDIMAGAVSSGLAGYKLPITFIGGITGSTLASGVTSVSFTGHQVGDVLIALGGSQQVGDPSFTAGWTKICSFVGSASPFRMGMFVWKRATSTASDTLTFTGTGTSAVAYSAGYIFRNVRDIGNFNVRSTASGTTTTTPDTPSLTLSDTTTGQSALVVATYTATATAVPNAMTLANGMGYGLLRSSWAGGTMTTAVALNVSGIVELLN